MEKEYTMLDDDEAAVAIKPNGTVTFYMPTMNEDDKVPASYLMAAAVAMRIQEDEEFVEDMMDWYQEHVLNGVEDEQE